MVSSFRMIKLFSLKQQKAEDEAAGKTGQKKTSAAQLRNVSSVVRGYSITRPYNRSSGYENIKPTL